MWPIERPRSTANLKEVTMHHSITVADLLRALGAIAALGLLGFGALAWFAGGMSDNGEAGAQAGRTGCIMGVAGIVLLVAALWGCSGR
jgi:fatty acid desaturase